MRCWRFLGYDLSLPRLRHPPEVRLDHQNTKAGTASVPGLRFRQRLLWRPTQTEVRPSSNFLSCWV
jgi:hypothetical protein